MQSRFDHYRFAILKIMEDIENKTGSMFHETCPYIDEIYWQAMDARDGGRMMFIYNQICKVLDELN